jgi:hypothetical protein
MAKRFGRAAVWSHAALLVLALSPLASAQVGYVKDIEGRWVLNGQPLKRGQALPARGRVTFEPSDALRNFITIGDNNARPIIHRNCENAGECDTPIDLPDAGTDEPSFVSELVGTVMGIWYRSGKRGPAAVVSRGGMLKEAVLKLEGDTLDLRPAFANLPRKQYLLRFVPQSHAREVPSLRAVPFNWDPQGPGKLSVKGLAPGAYELQLLSPQEREKLEHGTEAWVLVTTAAHYERALCSYMQAVAITSQWGKDTRPGTVRDFHRTYLLHLAGPGKR